MSEPYDTTITDRAVRAFSERLDYELRGAWRAGYDYVHYYTVFEHQPVDRYSLSAMVLPSYSKTPPRPDGLRYVETHVLKDLSPEEVFPDDEVYNVTDTDDLPRTDPDGNYLSRRQRRSLKRQEDRALENAITVEDLRDRLESLPDDTLVAVQASGAWNWAGEARETETKLAHPVLLIDEL